MHTVTIRLKTITPLFLGGADHQRGPAELRAPSIKGALRYWYRAIDPAYNQPIWKDGPTWEEYLFGSAGYGAGLFRLLVSGPQTRNWRWHDQRFRYDQAFTANPRQSDVKNGILYLGYTHDLGIKRNGNDRRAIPVGQDLTVEMHLRLQQANEECQKSVRRAVAAAWWLLGHVGGLGSRSRRGFGTVALQSWKAEPDSWPELSALPIAHTATTPEEWLGNFQQGLKQIKDKDWFPDSPVADHLVLGTNTKFYLIAPGAERGMEVGYSDQEDIKVEAWERALNRAGRLMQDFRQRYGLGSGGDYDAVAGHLGNEHQKAPCCVGRQRLSKPPDRAAFGLPLSFRYGSMEYRETRKDGSVKTITPAVTFQGDPHDRNASAIHIRIIQIGAKCYPFFARFDAPLLAKGEQVAIKGIRGKPNMPVGIGTQTILDDFCTKVLQPAAI